MSSSPSRFLEIDREGFPKFGEIRVSDVEYGAALLNSLFPEGRALKTKDSTGEYFVEAFDAGAVVLNIESAQQKASSLPNESGFDLVLPYGVRWTLRPETLSLDPWDRFNGLNDRGVPWVLSRPAQAEFFRLLADYDDTSVTFGGRRYEIPNFFKEDTSIQRADTWDARYQKEIHPGWDMGAPNPVLVRFLSEIKLNKLRVAVLGAGAGHDAAHLAQQGHLVTAIDFSREAEGRCRKLYGHLSNLKYEVQDVFEFCDRHRGEFDLVFDHTCFCAILPARRNDLVRSWKRLLTPQGQLLAIFFTMNNQDSTPYGASEWELEQRLKKHFRPLYWHRCRDSVPSRMGCELLYYGELTKTDEAL